MGNVRARWALMTLYERFEQIVAIALSLIIAILILIALVQLYERVCVFHAMPVRDFTACRSNISRDAGPGFHGMSVQDFTPSRPGFHGGPSR